MANGGKRSGNTKMERRLNWLRTSLRQNPGVQVALIGLVGTLITALATVLAALLR